MLLMAINRVPAIVLVAMILLAAACAGGSDGAVETAASTSPTTVPPVTASANSPATSTSTTVSESTPEPDPGPTTYTIEPGDSLAIIASEHEVALDALIAANGITDPNHIEVGQELVIPAPGQTFDAPAVPAADQAATPPPAPPSPPMPAVSGADVYFNHCSGCHGSGGEGAAGPALGGGAVVAKYPNPADQIAVVTNGRAAMPTYGGIIPPEEIEAVVYFTRTL
jgi:mono/diheme cytochrome c family protein